MTNNKPSYYYDPSVPTSFGPKSKRLPSDWWLTSRTYTLHKPVRYNFPTRPTITSAANSQYQADLMIMDKYRRKNRDFGYILVVIDVFSRFVWAYPVENKTGPKLAAAFQNLFLTNIPFSIQTDDGKEFFNSHVRKLFDKYKVRLFSVKSQFKASMAERVIRTLKERLWRYFTYSGDYVWIKVLPQLVQSYNNTPHSSLPNGITPFQAMDKYNWHRVWKHQQNSRALPPRHKPKFKMSDAVRISKSKGVFTKGYKPGWSEELFYIHQINDKMFPTTYKIRDYEGKVIEGSFYEPELQKVVDTGEYTVERVIKRGKDGRYLVKFYDSPKLYHVSQLKNISQKEINNFGVIFITLKDGKSLF